MALRHHLAQAAGSGFEQFIENFVLTPLLAQGHLRHFTRVEPKVLVLQHMGAQFRGVFAGQAAADWICLARGGIYVAAEAKSVAEDRLPRRAIEPQQEAHLDAAAQDGRALLFVELRGPGRMYAVPWPVRWTRLRTAESVGERELAPYRFTHWREVAERLLRRREAAEEKQA